MIRSKGMSSKPTAQLITVTVLLACAAGTAFCQSGKSRTDPENSNEARLNRLQPPAQVMDIIGAAPGMTIAEIGAGQGRYVVNLAERVGPSGRVYAEDIDADALRHCAERCRRNGFANVETILGGFTDPKFPPGALDLIFVISSYHHFSDPVALMRNARLGLKPTGRLAIAEWVKRPGESGDCIRKSNAGRWGPWRQIPQFQVD
jgi:ubiquinone/menaquinone biosynthesis C-methylase UbiE